MIPERELSPVVLFVYNRPWHTEMTLQSLAQNHFASRTDLVVYSDGPKTAADNHKIEEVRASVRGAAGFKSVTLIERSANLGLATSVINGVSEQIERTGWVIVLEDDMVTSPFFLEYMNDALELYRDEEKVISIHGYLYPVEELLPDCFFLPGADCWGWATWRRGWKLFEKDGQRLLSELRRRKLVEEFDLNGAYPYTRMLQEQIAGRNDSWAIRWHASAFLNGKLTLYPGRSLVHNIGTDASGTHCRASSELDVRLSSTRIILGNIPVYPSDLAFRQISKFLKQIAPSDMFVHRGLRALCLLLRGIWI